MADTKDTAKDRSEKAEPAGKAPLSRFKYVGNGDKGVNEFKSATYYDIQFPLGVEVEVPDTLVHKLRLKDDLVEVGSNVPKTFAEQQREKQAKQDAKGSKESVEDVTPEELAQLREKAAKFDAQVEKLRADAKAGR